jgi:hypothetical protein
VAAAPGGGLVRARKRWILKGVVAVVLVAVGIAIGSRIATPRDPGSVITVVGPSPRATPSPARAKATRDTRTPDGAVAAAAASVELLDGPALLDRTRIGRLVDRLAASNARDGLARAYEQGAARARARLAADSVPAPVVILRAALVGYRIDRFTSSAATVAVWRVGIVGSGATVQPQQAWRTETVSLVWERGSWKVASFASALGPTPPLPNVAETTAARDLFTEIPRFREFSHALP